MITLTPSTAPGSNIKDASKWESMVATELSAFFDRNSWTFARTMPKHPHEYVLLWKSSSKEDFFRFAMTIRRRGYDENFFTKRIRYMDLGGRRYWTMGDLLETTFVLNRAMNKVPDFHMASNPTPFRTNPPASSKTLAQVARGETIRLKPLSWPNRPHPMANLSKSKIIAFRQCPKRLWLEVHKPELREDSAATQAVFRVGNQVGEIARKLYDPDGDGVTINAQRDGYPKAYAQTDEFLAKADRPIFEAGLRIKGALAFADVLIPTTRGRTTSWKMVEVKSSGSVKDYHKDDIAVQSHIATASGVNLRTVSLACIDTSWVYPGDGDYQGLLYETDLTQEALSRGDEAAGWISEAQKLAAMPSEPKIGMGGHCHDPFECGFCNYCSRGLKQPDYPVDWLPSISAKKRAQLAEQGIDDLRQVPDGMLNTKQQLVKDHTTAGTTYFDAAGAAADLAAHKLPACFLDFETVNLAVPVWKGTRPYQQVPFQFSLHKVAAKGALSHESFLDLSGCDPSLPFAKALIASCGNKGPVFVYNATFERSRILDLARRLPRLGKPLTALVDRIVDLLPVARDRYYHPSQRGSWSIKDVLPAVAPDVDYGALDGVKDGGMATLAFQEAILSDTPPGRKEEIRRQLDAYCRLDTFAMVRLWHFFSGRVGKAPRDSD